MAKSLTKNPFFFGITFFTVVIIFQKTPLYLLFESIGLETVDAKLVDTTISNIIIVIVSVFLIKKNNLFAAAGLSFTKVKDSYLFLLLLGYAYFSIEYHIVSKINTEDLLTFTVFLFLVKSITVGFFEEIVFRGLIQGKFLYGYKNDEYGIYKSVFFTALLFGLGHGINIFDPHYTTKGVFTQMYYATCIGAFFGALLLRTKNVYPIIFVHFLVSFCALLGTLFPEYFPDKIPKEKSTTEIVASAVLIIAIFSIPLIIAMQLLKNLTIQEVLETETDESITKQL